jgi:DNA-binding transcriptional MocR family regulator
MSFWTPNLTKYEPPLYNAIAEAIRDAIKANDLKPGDRLLPHRIMAEELGVTIGTVARGYNLAAEWGLVSGEVGRGTIVMSPEDTYPYIPLTLGPTFIDLGVLQPTTVTNPALRKEAFEDTLKAVGKRWRNGVISGYPPELGHRHHRKAGIKWLARMGIQADVEEIVVTSGAQEAFQLLLSAYTRPGDAILVEELTHLGLKNIGNFLKLNMIGISMDDMGLMPQSLDEACRQSNARILFLTPTLQSPTTAIMELGRRQEILSVARRHNLFIIENDPFSEFTADPPPPIAALAPDRTAYVSSLSYCASPEIRIGYMKIMKPNIPELQSAKRALSIAGSSVSAEIATQWINSGISERLLKWQKDEIQSRHQIATQVLKGLDYKYNPCGLFLWLNLPQPWRASDFATEAKDRNVMVLEAERFAVGRGASPHAVRISLTSSPHEKILHQGLKTIVDLLNGSNIEDFLT